MGNLCDTFNPISCPPGSGKNGNGCAPCVAGEYSIGVTCTLCRKGTASAALEAPSPQTCQPCAAGTYAASIGQKTCLPCESGSCTFASFTSPSPTLVEIKSFVSVVYDQDRVEITSQKPESDIGYIYLGIFFGFVMFLALMIVPFRNKFRRYVVAVAGVLKTPMSYIRITASKKIDEIPSFYRGLVGIWVIAGLALITIYQINVFVTQRTSEISAVQPGTVFTDKSSTSTTSTGFTMSVFFSFHNTPISCNPTDFSFSVTATGVRLSGTLFGAPVCTSDSTSQSVNLTFAFPSPLSFTSTSSVSLQVTSQNGSPLFSHGVSYELHFDSFEHRTVVMNETLTHDASRLLTGDVAVDLSAIPTEYLNLGVTSTHGYSYSQFASTAVTLDYPTSAILTVAFTLPVSLNNYKIDTIDTISALQFVTNLVALASGVIAGGSLGANLVSYLYTQWKKHHSGGSKSKQLEVPLLEPEAV